MNPLSTVTVHKSSRRGFLQTSTRAFAGAAVAAAVARPGCAAEANTLRVALIGCGGRGTGAVANALATRSGPIRLFAMADLFENTSTTIRSNTPSPTAPASSSNPAT